MTELIRQLLGQLKDKSYRALRTETTEQPILYPVDLFGFHFGSMQRQHVENGNVTPHYSRIITKGFDRIKEEIAAAIATTNDTERRAFGKAMLGEIEQILADSDHHRELAKKQGQERLYQALLTVPHRGATTFFEACVFLKLCIYFLRRAGGTHLGLGRFDQYMYPFFEADKARGVSDEALFETLEAFFVSLNYDTDLYQGIQQGDNGQSMVLGGFHADGSSAYNALSDMCMRASLELCLIDPKINLRVGKNTPDELYIFATELTKQGLGFPQYCNDDVVIPGLLKLGYAPEDAQNYVVAACWEYIVPHCGADVPNLQTMNFPLVVGDAIRRHLPTCNDFEALMADVTKAVATECDRLITEKMNATFAAQPLFSVFIDGCIESLCDMRAGGARYMNFGCHGAGIANAADALAAIKMTVFEKRTVTADTLLTALENDFEGYTELRNELRACPKMGNNEDYVDDIATALMTCFGEHMNGRDNGHGGVWRAGTGSAMEYILSAKKCPATADGRRAGEPYSSSFSPSLDVKTSGLLSVLQSFTKYDMTEIINGGPLTLEVHDTVLRNDIGTEKVAMLVKSFILLGGHQLQINSINRERLMDAQKHPENYPNLIVRVWGWSGYFNELDVKYQNHIIRRVEYSV